MVTPTGGEKDINPPKLVKAKPLNLSTNFNSKNIELTFNEYLNLKDIQNQFIISPSDIEADIKKDGKKIIIKLSNTPKSNTTYILNFGDAISDYTENNILKDFKYIFSTAENIDSVKFEGDIIDAYKMEPIKDVIVCLYSDTTSDSIVYKRKPDYTVRTDDFGKFKFTNLKNSKYRFFAIKESNNNKIFDSQDEQIAFSDTIINLNQNLVISNIKIFTENPKERKLLSKDISYQKVVLILNKKNNIQLIDVNPEIDTIIYSKDKDTIITYYKNNADSTSLYLSENNKIDTVNVKFPKSLKKKDLNISFDTKLFNNKIILQSSDYFHINNLDSIKLHEDSTIIDFKIKRLEYNKFELAYNFDKEKKYTITIGDSAFVSFQKMYNKKIKTGIGFYTDEELGTLNIKSKINNNIIYELLNEKNEIVKRSISNKEENINYTQLIPGTYRLRIIKDLNKNGVWDTGNYIQKIQPEEINYYINPIKIRANWDMEIEVTP